VSSSDETPSGAGDPAEQGYVRALALAGMILGDGMFDEMSERVRQSDQFYRDLAADILGRLTEDEACLLVFVCIGTDGLEDPVNRLIGDAAAHFKCGAIPKIEPLFA